MIRNREDGRFFAGSGDKYQLAFKDAVKSNVDQSFFDKVDWRLLEVDGHRLLIVDVEPSARSCYFGKSEDFYIRVNPAAQKLTGSELVNYIQTHFGT